MKAFGKFVLTNSIAVWSVLAALFALGLGFDWWSFDPKQIALIQAFYIALVMMFRQFFSLVGDDVQNASQWTVTPSLGIEVTSSSPNVVVLPPTEAAPVAWETPSNATPGVPGAF